MFPYQTNGVQVLMLHTCCD